MGGDHWLFEKLGYWDESFHVPLIIRDPDPGAVSGSGTGGPGLHRVGRRAPHHLSLAGHRGARCRPTASPSSPSSTGRASGPGPVGTATGRGPRRTGGPRPTGAGTSPIRSHWPPSSLFGIPMAHCALDVVRGRQLKYVQFAADGRRPAAAAVRPGGRPGAAARPGAGRRGLRAGMAGRPAPAAVADAQRRPHLVRHHAHRSGRGRGRQGRVALTGAQPGARPPVGT